MIRPQALQDRLYRAKSWMNAAAALPPDQKHAHFAFLYIAFNALYGCRRYEGSREEVAKDRQEFLKRLKTMTEYDSRYGVNLLRRALKTCHKECRELIVNYFLRDSYWRKEKTSQELSKEFTQQWRWADQVLSRGKYEVQLDLVLRRLTVLRNQIMHGCVTYGPTSKGLPSLLDGLAVLREIMPAFYELMQKYGHHVTWPAIPYPRVGSDAHPNVDEWHADERR
jgi:hypothetical protein